MAWIEQLAPRDTDIGSSRAYDATRDSLYNGFRFRENKRGRDAALGKQEREEWDSRRVNSILGFNYFEQLVERL